MSFNSERGYNTRIWMKVSWKFGAIETIWSWDWNRSRRRKARLQNWNVVLKCKGLLLRTCYDRWRHNNWYCLTKCSTCFWNIEQLAKKKCRFILFIQFGRQDSIMFHINRESANECSLFSGNSHFSFGSFLRELLKRKTNAIKRSSYCYLDALEIVRDSTGGGLGMEPLHHVPNPSITSRKT